MIQNLKFAGTVVLALLVIGCSPFESEMELSARAVVQAYLVPNQKIEVQVTREVLFNDTDTTRALTNLSITISEDATPYILQYAGNGTYANEDLIAKTGHTYTIEFEYDGKIINASTSIPEKPESFVSTASTYTVASFQPGSGGARPTFPDPIELTWNNVNQQYFLIAVKNIEDEPVMINENTNRPAFVFRNDPSQAATYQLRPQQFQYYGSHLLILYHLTPEYAALYQNNGSSSLNIKTPYTNVINGLGIFTGVNADTLQLEVLKP